LAGDRKLAIKAEVEGLFEAEEFGIELVASGGGSGRESP